MSYYVYGLLDPDEPAVSRDEGLAGLLASVFYVGKGTGGRMHQHAADARQVLRDEGLAGTPTETKLGRIMQLIDEGREPRAIKLVAGFENEQDAYRAEALAIDAVNAVRTANGRTPLRNAVKGHGITIEDMGNYMQRLDVEDLAIDWSADQESILVKGTRGPAYFGEYERAEGDPDLVAWLPAEARDRVDVMLPLGYSHQGGCS